MHIWEILVFATIPASSVPGNYIINKEGKILFSDFIVGQNNSEMFSRMLMEAIE